MRNIKYARIIPMNIMRALIRDRVYTTPSSAGYVSQFRPNIKWVMDFKKVSLNQSYLNAFAEGFEKLVLSSHNQRIQIAGMESGALSLLTALSLRYPDQITNALYVRKSRKKNDLAKRVEGECISGVPIVLIDDVLNSGATIKKQIEIFREEGQSISIVFTVIRYRNLEYYQNIFGEGIKVVSMFELDDFTSDLGLRNLGTSNEVLQQGALYKKYSPTWKVSLGRANHYDVIPKSAPFLDGEVIYLGSDEGSLFAIDAQDGSKKWEYKTTYTANHKGIYSSPLVYKDKVIFGSYDGNVYALNKFTGKREWVFLDADYVGSSPKIAEDLKLLFIGLEYGLFQKHGGIAALHAETGQIAWIHRDVSYHVHATPGYSTTHKIVVCGANNGFVYAYDARSGEKKWEYKTNGEIKYGVAFDDTKNLVCVGSFDGGLYVLNIKNGKPIHRFSAHAGFYTSPVICGDLAIIGSLDRTIYAFNLVTKEIAWEVETRGRVFGAPLAHEGHVYIGSNDGCLYKLDIASGEIKALIQLTERIVNKPALRDHTLYIATHAAELYRFDLAPEV
jgi:outer membrane protein assembly factor BamB